MTEITHHISQAAITICSAVAIWLQGSTNFGVKRAAFIVSLIGQPFWFLTAYTNKQWGIAMLAFWFTYCNVRGYFKHRQ